MTFLRAAVISAVLGGAAFAGLSHPQSNPTSAEPTDLLTPVVLPSAGSDTEFVTIENQDETMTMQVPKTWIDVSQGAWMRRGSNVGFFLSASTNLADFQAGRAAPGVFMGVFSGQANRSALALLDTERVDVTKRCHSTGRRAYEDKFYVGNIDDYTQCGGSQQRSLVSVVQSGDGSTVLLRVNIASEADVEVANRIFASFQVLGSVDEHDHGHSE